MCTGKYGSYGNHPGTNKNYASSGVKNVKIDWNSLGHLSWPDWNEDISQHRKKWTRQKIGSPGAGKDELSICTTTLY